MWDAILTHSYDLRLRKKGGENMRYVPGAPHHIRFGEYGEKVDSHGVCLYGDASDPATQWEMDAAQAEVLDQAALTDHQKISFWFRFADIRPYGKVCDLSDQIMTMLEGVGWKRAPTIEGYPDTGSSIDYLADTHEPTHWDKPQEDFPGEPNAHGYNAAGGFSLVVEKLGTKPTFSDAEIEEIRQLALRAAQLVFGHDLPEIN
jgi:hypothetical protein